MTWSELFAQAGYRRKSSAATTFWEKADAGSGEPTLLALCMRWTQEQEGPAEVMTTEEKASHIRLTRFCYFPEEQQAAVRNLPESNPALLERALQELRTVQQLAREAAERAQAPPRWPSRKGKARQGSSHDLP